MERSRSRLAHPRSLCKSALAALLTGGIVGLAAGQVHLGGSGEKSPSESGSGGENSMVPQFGAAFDSFVKHSINWLWLFLAIVICYGVGWLILRALVKAKESPGNAGCMGCFFLSFLMMIFVIIGFFGFLTGVFLPPTTFWLLVAILAVVALILIFTRGKALVLPLILLVALILGLSAFAFSKRSSGGEGDSNGGGSSSTGGGEGVDNVTPGPKVTDPKHADEAVAVVVSHWKDDPPKAGHLGTGFFISGSGRLITCGHVVGQPEMVQVWLKNGEKLDATVVQYVSAVDLAVLQVSGKHSTSWLSIGAPSEVHQGDDVVVWGFPLGATGSSTDSVSIQPDISTGIVRAKRQGPVPGCGISANYIQISVPVTHGNSGGPVIDRATCKVIGVVESGTPDSSGNTVAGLNNAIGVEEIQKVTAMGGRASGTSDGSGGSAN